MQVILSIRNLPVLTGSQFISSIMKFAELYC